MTASGYQTSSSRVLLVEGKSDEHVIRHIMNKGGLEFEDFSIINKENVDQLLKGIGPEVKVEGRKVVGILVDADESQKKRWEEVRGRLLRAGVMMDPLPEEHAESGVIVEDGLRIGVWIMPDNQSRGELEDFIGEMIPSGDPVWPLARAYIDGIPVTVRQFRTQKTTRAVVHAWLATRREPRPMGLAIGTGDLDIEVDLCLRLRTWLEGLFG